MKLFSGSSNKPLAHDLAKTTNFALGEMELSLFSNEESRVWIKSQVPETVALLQSFSRPVDHHIVEFCLIADALKRQGASQINAIIPWFGYSKQDRVFRPGEPLSVKVIANLIQTTPIKKIITFDLHNPTIMGFFDTPVVNLRALPLFVDYFHSNSNQSEYCVVSPDAGAVKTSTEFANSLNVGVAYINKKRDLETGKVTIVDIDRPIEGKHIIILDDMIATGSTMLSVSQFCKSKGATAVTIAATHHLYLPEVQKNLDHSAIDQVIVTDTIQKPPEIISTKLQVLSVAGLIASALN